MPSDVETMGNYGITYYWSEHKLALFSWDNLAMKLNLKCLNFGQEIPLLIISSGYSTLKVYVQECFLQWCFKSHELKSIREFENKMVAL